MLKFYQIACKAKPQERIGIRPDIEVPSEKAFDKAIELARVQ